MTVVQSLRKQAGLIASGALSFILLVAGMRAVGGEPLVQPHADLGVLIGVAMVSLYFVINDPRGGAAQ